MEERGESEGERRRRGGGGEVQGCGEMLEKEIGRALGSGN